jgi:hypothetical protein
MPPLQPDTNAFEVRLRLLLRCIERTEGPITATSGADPANIDTVFLVCPHPPTKLQRVTVKVYVLPACMRPEGIAVGTELAKYLFVRNDCRAVTLPLLPATVIDLLTHERPPLPVDADKSKYSESH